jgi:ABC-type bacteriocin/lantibiotic exporter with double-glycine peptidase domain
MSLRPPLYRQETPYSCVPACLRMVLSSLGHEVTEASVRAVCDCTVFGTEALKAVDAMRQCGFPGTTKQTCTLEELRAQLHGGQWPIVFLNTLPITGERNAHAVVAIEVESVQVTVYDPLDGERVLPQATFLTAWAMMHNLTLLIQR